MDDSFLLHKTIYYALIEIRSRARESKDKVAYGLSDLLHNAILQLGEAADGKQSYKTVKQKLIEYADEKGYTPWLDSTWTQICDQHGGSSDAQRPSHSIDTYHEATTASEGPISLSPEDGEYLACEETIARCTAKFSYMIVDAGQGEAGVDSIVECYARRRKGALDADDQFDEIAERFCDKRGESYQLLLADREQYGDEYISTLLMPEESVFFAFSSDLHERCARPLVERFAKVVGYTAE